MRQRKGLSTPEHKIESLPRIPRVSVVVPFLSGLNGLYGEALTLNSRLNSTMRGLISAAVFALGLSFMFQSWDIALVITLSLGFHELGHILVIQAMGVKWEFGFSYMGAWTRTPLKTREAIGHFGNSLIHLAGPLFSFLLSVIAIAVYLIGDRSIHSFFWIRLANFSVLLAITNLLPIGAMSDGGKFLRRLSASFTHQDRVRYFILAIQLFVVFSEHFKEFNSARTISLAIFALWFFAGFLMNLKSETTEAPDSGSMTQRQAGILFSFMMMLILYSYLVTVLTPFWLTEEDVLHVLYAIERNAIAFLRLPPMTKWGLLMVIAAASGGIFLGVKRHRKRKTPRAEGE
jgi:hypothetical protein